MTVDNVRVCPRCGAENRPDAQRCAKCNGTLDEAVYRALYAPSPPVPAREEEGPEPGCIVAALVVGGAVALAAALAVWVLSLAAEAISAVQVTQVYTQGAFWLLLLIVLLLAAGLLLRR